MKAPPSASTPALAIIIPVLNDAGPLAQLLDDLAAWRAVGAEIIVVDGGSVDASRATASGHADQVLSASRGRAAQMNAGARAARAPLLWFVHADTRVPVTARPALLAASTAHDGWGRFDITLNDPAWPFRVIESAINLRSRVSGIATGDQGLFVARALFERVGGYPPIELMEDLALSRSLRRYARPRCLGTRLTTSARRWREHGIVRTVMLMWLLRLAWCCGMPPARLARLYGYH